jgi:hypothetical protein
MNFCLHYEVGHKTVLKSNDQAKSTPKQTVKYNMSKAKKHPKQELLSEETPPEMVRAAHVPPQDKPLQQPKARKPLGTTLHGEDTERGHHVWP